MEIALTFAVPNNHLSDVNMRGGKMKLTVGSLNGILTGELTGAEFNVECVQDSHPARFHATYVVQDKSPKKCQQKAKKLESIVMNTIKPEKVFFEVYK